MKIVTLKELAAQGITNIKTLDEATRVYNDLKDFIEVEIVVHVTSHNGGTYFEYWAKCVFSQFPTLSVRTSNKEYIFHELSTDFLPNLDNTTRSDIIRKFAEPNRFKVPTVKKLNSWIDYKQATTKALLEAEAVNAKKIEDFKASLDGLNVDWYKNTGRIDLNGITFKFSIDNGRVYQELDLYATATNGSYLETFKLLANNDYKK